MKVGGEIGENILLVEISSYMVVLKLLPYVCDCVHVPFQSFMHCCSMIFLSCWRNTMRNSTCAAIQQRLSLATRRSTVLLSEYKSAC